MRAIRKINLRANKHYVNTESHAKQAYTSPQDVFVGYGCQVGLYIIIKSWQQRIITLIEESVKEIRLFIWRQWPLENSLIRRKITVELHFFKFIFVAFCTAWIYCKWIFLLISDRISVSRNIQDSTEATCKVFKKHQASQVIHYNTRSYNLQLDNIKS